MSLKQPLDSQELDDLTALLQKVHDYSGLAHKADIAQIAPNLTALPDGWHPNGDDTAAIPGNDGYTLLAMEGLLTAFVAEDPWFAGWCSVMVNVSDIAAMGGRPQAIVNALWSHDPDSAALIAKGMREAADTFRIPIVGGHTNLRSNQPQLAVGILGHAQRLLSSFAARPGQRLVAAIDLRGDYQKPYLNWNAATTAPAERLRGDIELLPEIAEKSLAIAAKDISQAGLLGTTLMLMESSGVGMRIDLESIPKPAGVAWSDWLCTFPSFGYLLTTSHENLPLLLERFHGRGITAVQIGEVTATQQLWVENHDDRQLFHDLSTTLLTGLGHPTASIPQQEL
ncbi:MAG: sll0787 family AIR synthase-like protein [Halomonas sp.]|uniref:sll0787 family AIR synthase-like protein n=1 Tax=Halomonas sp. TaxID=1486246 RepID=UPI003F923D68